MSDTAAFWDALLADAALPWGRAPSPGVALLSTRLSPGARVLVPGCGYGRNALALAERGHTVVACDHSAVGIEHARAAFPHANLTYVVGDALDPPRGPFAGVLCHFLLHLFRAPERRQLVAALVERLAPGGLLLATGLSTRAPFFGNGEELEPDTWSNPGWVPIHFYTPATLAAELAPLRTVEAAECDEPEDKPTGRVLTPAVYALARKS